MSLWLLMSNCLILSLGGYRLWPLAGYWTPSEFAGYVGECSPSIRCLGGRFPECAEGYTGDFCSSCATGFDRNGQLCLPYEHCIILPNLSLRRCPATDFESVLLIIIGVAFFCCIVFAIVVQHDHALGKTMLVLSVLQLIRATGQMVCVNRRE